MMLNLPNILSFCRLPLAVLIVIYFQSPIKYVFFGVALFLDFFDGYLARKFGKVSKLGGVIDPLVDKVFVLIIFFYVFFSFNLPIYYLFFFFIRDIFTLGGAVIVNVSKIKIALKARMAGKVVTNVQFVVLLFMLMGSLFWIEIGMYVLFLVSLASIVDYILYAKKIMK